jgi:hypothetical protein
MIFERVAARLGDGLGEEAVGRAAGIDIFPHDFARVVDVVSEGARRYISSSFSEVTVKVPLPVSAA